MHGHRPFDGRLFPQLGIGGEKMTVPMDRAPSAVIHRTEKREAQQSAEPMLCCNVVSCRTMRAGAGGALFRMGGKWVAERAFRCGVGGGCAERFHHQ